MRGKFLNLCPPRSLLIMVDSLRFCILNDVRSTTLQSALIIYILQFGYVRARIPSCRHSASAATNSTNFVFASAAATGVQTVRLVQHAVRQPLRAKPVRTWPRLRGTRYEVGIGLGRILALHDWASTSSATLYQIR